MTKQNKKEKELEESTERETHAVDGHFGHYVCHTMSPKWIMTFVRPS
jgi:hypothetical protein